MLRTRGITVTTTALIVRPPPSCTEMVSPERNW